MRNALVALSALISFQTTFPTLVEAAETLEAESSRASGITHDISAGLSVYSFDYSELVPVGKSAENATLPGLHLEYQTRFSEEEYVLGLSTDLAFSDLRHDGTNMNGSVVVQGNTGNKIFNLEANFGKNALPSSEQLELVPYVGLGFHLWDRDLRTVGPGGYLEKYRWFYLPIGARFGLRQSSTFSIQLDASLRWNLGGSIFGQLSDVALPGGARMDDHDGSLGSALGFRVALPVRYAFSSNMGVSVVPWYEQVKIGKGDMKPLTFNGGNPTGRVVGEPESTTDIFGVLAAYHLMF